MSTTIFYEPPAGQAQTVPPDDYHPHGQTAHTYNEETGNLTCDQCQKLVALVPAKRFPNLNALNYAINQTMRAHIASTNRRNGYTS